MLTLRRKLARIQPIALHAFNENVEIETIGHLGIGPSLKPAHRVLLGAIDIESHRTSPSFPAHRGLHRKSHPMTLRYLSSWGSGGLSTLHPVEFQSLLTPLMFDCPE